MPVCHDLIRLIVVIVPYCHWAACIQLLRQTLSLTVYAVIRLAGDSCNYAILSPRSLLSLTAVVRLMVHAEHAILAAS